MHGFGVTILGVLNQKYHEEGDNGRGGVYDQLPGVGEMKCRTGEQPDGNHKHSSSKCPGATEDHGGTVCENAECILDDTKEISGSLALFRFLGLSLVPG